jgi:hypothetical protein
MRRRSGLMRARLADIAVLNFPVHWFPSSPIHHRYNAAVNHALLAFVPSAAPPEPTPWQPVALRFHSHGRERQHSPLSPCLRNSSPIFL